MNFLQSTRHSNLLRALLNLKDRNVLETVGSEVLPVVDVENERPELQIFNFNDLAAGFGAVTGAAGQNGAVFIANPANSGILVVLEKVLAFVSAAQTIEAKFDTDVTTGSAGSLGFMDTRRVFGAPSGVVASCVARLRLRTSETATVVNTIARFTATTSIQSVDQCEGVVLSPGRAFGLNCTTNATTITGLFRWRERVIEPTESRA